ncbi:uncharacterized protein LOC119658713 isoform X2 [Hermetia illucens]|uniref:uncharacterized protein LOC119658713 isoform X2 n=1 Tax=Hermetia illucens TaxID=343691 RepID=UPI0018CC2180|nr:uncharacterized protein LOC119658713 isoform X2 [Hermetia illucens]
MNLKCMAQYSQVIFSVLIAQPFMLNEEVEDASLNCLLEENSEWSKRLRKAIYSNQKVQDNLRRLLPVISRRQTLADSSKILEQAESRWRTLQGLLVLQLILSQIQLYKWEGQ